jgi:hypothetical protein
MTDIAIVVMMIATMQECQLAILEKGLNTIGEVATKSVATMDGVATIVIILVGAISAAVTDPSAGVAAVAVPAPPNPVRIPWSSCRLRKSEYQI